MIQTIIAPTIHRARQLQKLETSQLIRAITLEDFIQVYYDHYGKNRVISNQEASAIIAFLFIKQNKEHFDYVTAQSDSIEGIANFIIEVRRNDVGIKDFLFSSKKEQELLELYLNYELFLQQQNLFDIASKDKFVLEAIIKDVSSLKSFGVIKIADFKQDEIHFEASKTQEKLLEVIRKDTISIKQEKLEASETKFYEPSQKPFNIFDEVSSALKIARKLLDDGVDADDIVIVTSSINEYAPIFETLFDSYGLKGYSSKGTLLHVLIPLLKNKDNKDEIITLARNKINQIKSDIKKQVATLLNMGITIDANAEYEKLVKTTYIKPKTKVGLLLTEPNQLFSSNAIKHLIFVGTDMGHFPPTSKENFLATALQKETLLHGTNIYQSSYSQYLHMKNIAQNLYIVTATYKGKTKLARSHLITEKCEAFNVSDVLALHELPKEFKRPDSGNIDEYLNQNAIALNPYDGYDAGGYDVQTLSASQLSSYAMCPRRYFFDRVLKLSAPNKPEEGLEASDKGTIMHKCFELFAIDTKAGVITLGSEVDETIKKHMNEKAIIAYELFLKENEITANIHHKLYFQELTRGLLEDNDGQGVLINFLHFITQNHSSINGFRNSEFEMEFRLDKDFNLVANDQAYFIKGYIDRVDIKADEIRIVDYKSKKASGLDKAKLEQMLELKDMQLALYILYARRAFGDKNIESYLQTFKSEKLHAEFAKAATYEVGKEGEYLHYDEEFEKSLIARIEAIKTSMAQGDFHYDDSDENHCEWCEFKIMCN